VLAVARATGRIASLLRLHDPDLIVNWSAKTQLYGAVAALRAGQSRRVVWWQHGITAGNWMDRLATILPAQLVGSSSEAASQAQQSLWPHRATAFVHPGIDQPALASEADLVALRRQLGIPEGRTVLGTVGRLQPGKGQDSFLRAISGLRARGHEVHGVVVGGDAYGLSRGYEGSLRRLAEDLGLAERVNFTGQVEAAGPYMQAMDIYVSASLGESFGIVITEAMALRVAVAAFATGGPAEIIENGRSGFLLPAGDVTALVDCLERLVVDARLRSQLATAGYERFCSKFSADRMARQIESLFQQLCLN
jgi:glycosyltransferase involved in cell wall biosynthesis